MNISWHPSQSFWKTAFRRVASSIWILLIPVAIFVAVETVPMHPKLAQTLHSLAYILFVVLLLMAVRKVALIALEWGNARAGALPSAQTLQQGFVPLLKNIVTLVIFLMGAIMLLKHFGYDVMSLLAALGVGSLAVGLAAKDTLTNMISGFTLIIDRNLRPGDRVNLSGSVGIVEEIGLRSTRLNLRDGNILIVPNSELVNTKIVNLSMNASEAVCSSKIRVPLSVPFARVREICIEEAKQVRRLRPGFNPVVLLSSLMDGHQLVTVVLGLSDPDHSGEALSDLHERLTARMSKEGITLLSPIPLPL